jgi:transposase
MPKLSEEEKMTLRVLKDKGQSNRHVARLLDVTEGAVRYHQNRRKAGLSDEDARRDKPFEAEAYATVIREWVDVHERSGSERPVNVKELHEHLVTDHGYPHSYKSVLRYIRATFPKPRIRANRRVELPPGVQAQVDWKECVPVLINGAVEVLHALVMVLSFSRMPAVVWSRKKDQLSWLHCHNEAFRRLDGIPAVVRIDNLKTGVSSGAGWWGKVNPIYQSYAETLGFHVDPCGPGAPERKGKVESRIGKATGVWSIQDRSFMSMAELQGWTDEKIQSWALRGRCPATGQTVATSYEGELRILRRIDTLPEPFDVAVTRPVWKDCMVYFENHSYPVPFSLVDQTVEVRGCAGSVQIYHAGERVREYPRHTAELVLIDESCYEGAATDRVLPPLPLGKLGKRILELADEPVQRRSIEWYADLMEVAR